MTQPKTTNKFKDFLKSAYYFKQPVFALSKLCSKRSDLAKILPNFYLICLYKNEDLKNLRKKGLNIFCLEEQVKQSTNLKKYTIKKILKHPKTLKFIKKKTPQNNKPLILTTKSNLVLERLAKKNHWNLAVNSYKLYKKLNHKTYFETLVEKLKIKNIIKEKIKFKDLDFKKIIKKYPTGFLIQEPNGGGGNGTYFVENLKKFNWTIKKLKLKPKIKPNSCLLVSQFINHCYSPCINACIVGKKIIQADPHLQLIDLVKCHSQVSGNGVFCGNDWSSSTIIPDEIKKEMQLIVKKIGKILIQEKFQGIFGIDFLVDKDQNKVFPIEINPRLLGSLPVLSFSQVLSKKVPLIFYHLLEFSPKKNRLLKQIKVTGLAKINQNKPQQGSHFFLNLPYKPCLIKNRIKSGIHQIKNNKIEYLRPGFSLSDLKNKKEFIVTDNRSEENLLIPQKNKLKRILRILSLAKTTQNQGSELNSKGTQIVELVYQRLDIRPCKDGISHL